MGTKPIVYIIATLILLVAIGCLAVATNENDTYENENVDDGSSTPQMVDFLSYQRIYGKVYESYTELLRRSQLFYARAMRVFVVGVEYLQGKSTKFLKIGFFSDRTDRERASLFENLVENDSIPVMRDNSSTIRRRKRSTTDEMHPDNLTKDSSCLPTRRNIIDSAKSILRALGGRKRNENSRMHLDYRKSGCIPSVKNQKSCGACYIFSMMTLYEYHHCMATGKLAEFSEQYILDCAPAKFKTMFGCLGGVEWETVEFVEKFGLESAQRLPFKGRSTKCPYASRTDPSVMGSTRVHHATSMFTLAPISDRLKMFQMVEEYHAPDSGLVTKFQLKFQDAFNAQTLTENLERYGPLALTIRQTFDMLEYGGGVDLMEDCYMIGGHSMAIVGHGVENGEEFFLVRNSLGPKWGLRGYYKLSKRLNPKCFVRYGYIEVEFSRNESYKRRA